MPKSGLTNGRPQAFAVPEIERRQGFMYTLFALEDLYGLKIELVDSEVTLRVNSKGTESPDNLNSFPFGLSKLQYTINIVTTIRKKASQGIYFKAAKSIYQENFAKE